MQAIVNGKLILPDERGVFRFMEDRVLLYDEKIISILPQEDFDAAGTGAQILDAEGCYVAPGFINIHIHGCAGWDTMDEDGRALPAMRVCQAKTGVTSLLPTTMTCDVPEIQGALERIRQAMAVRGGADVLGCHMEGPFISPERKGAQKAEHIRRADFSLLEPYQDVVKILTLAPEELGGNPFFIRQCQKAGILVSMGHTAADYDTARKAIEEWGVLHVTHLYNAMTPFQQREPGAVGAALDTAANCELITDNIHSHPMAQRLAYRMKGSRHLILITDSMRACGLGDGESELGGQKVYVKGQRATLADGTIAGSVLTMDRAMAVFRQNTGAPLAEVVSMVTQLPAQELGIYGMRGVLLPGRLADITIFDEALQIRRTIVRGRTVYAADSLGK